jgi:peptidoglycan/LPS O-acetylase OafA/YrhL
MVMFYHCGFLLSTEKGGRQNLASQNLVSFSEAENYTYFGFVGVQIFFVISGFVIAFSSERATKFSFFVSRVVRLGPAVWICATITLFSTLMVGFASPTSEWYLYLRGIFFLPWGGYIDGSYWTLSIEISFYILVFY